MLLCKTYYNSAKEKNKGILCFSTKGINFFKYTSLTSKAKYPLTMWRAFISVTSNAVQALRFKEKKKRQNAQCTNSVSLLGNNKYVLNPDCLFQLKLRFFQYSFIFFKSPHVLPHCLLFCKCLWALIRSYIQLSVPVPFMDLGFTQ